MPDNFPGQRIDTTAKAASTVQPRAIRKQRVPIKSPWDLTATKIIFALSRIKKGPWRPRLWSNIASFELELVPAHIHTIVSSFGGGEALLCL